MIGLARKQKLVCCGLLAPAMHNPCGQKIGIWGIDIRRTDRRILARTDRDLGGPAVGTYSFDAEALDWSVSVVKRALDPTTRRQCDLLIVDEIGKLELWRGIGLASVLGNLASGEVDRTLVLVRESLLADLQTCTAGYSPTQWQRSRLPALFHEKVRVIFDGVDTELWRPHEGIPRQLGNRTIPEDMRVVTYVARGFESMRGFDVFMKVAKRLCDRRRDVIFVVVGEDRLCYGGDDQITGEKSFKDWVLKQGDYDLSRFIFPGRIPPPALAQLFSLSDLHVYLTVPFVLSWSLMNALACGTTVLASDTEPVREMIEHEKNGLLADFFDVDGLAATAERVLDAPGEFRHLGQAGREMIRSRYSLPDCLEQMLGLYREVLSMATA